MKPPRAPKLDERRGAEFETELQERARAWIPEWGLADGDRDFGRALLEIAARFNSEVAEHLDNVGEKMRRGFLDWLAVRGEAARPSRMPVAFKLADAAQEAVLARGPVRMQVDAEGTPVVFETEKDLRVVPGQLDVVVGVDANKDEFFLPPPGLSDLLPLEPAPTQWVLKSFVSAGATKLQLDPDSGLAPEMIVEAAGRQYRIVKVDNEIVTIEPGLAAELPQSSIVRKVTAFAPFDGIAINRQEHALYLGHMEVLNIEAAATIEIVGATTLRTGVTWQYWGKADGNDEDDWRLLTLAASQQADAVVLEKQKGAVEPLPIDGKDQPLDPRVHQDRRRARTSLYFRRIRSNSGSIANEKRSHVLRIVRPRRLHRPRKGWRTRPRLFSTACFSRLERNRGSSTRSTSEVRRPFRKRAQTSSCASRWRIERFPLSQPCAKDRLRTGCSPASQRTGPCICCRSIPRRER